MKDFKVVFMGTPDFAVASLDAIVKAGLQVVGVVTAPDRPAGRGRKLNESAVKQYAKNLDVPILQPEKLKDPDFLTQLQNLKADLNVVVAFRMLPEIVWNMPKHGTINLHGSLLPQYRGAAPINWAIIRGEKKTGVTTFFIDKEIDTGDIIDRAEIEISETDNVGTLHDKMMIIGANLLAGTVSKIAAGQHIKRIGQASEITNQESVKHAPKIFKDDCRINWNMNTNDVYNFIRGLSPYPAAWSVWSKQEKELSVKIFAIEKFLETPTATAGTIDSDGKKYLRIACADGWLQINELQLQGKKRMPIDAFLRGVQLEQFTACLL